MFVEGIIDEDRAKRSLKLLTKTFLQNYTAFTNFGAPGDMYLFKVNDGNARTICEICSELTI